MTSNFRFPAPVFRLLSFVALLICNFSFAQKPPVASVVPTTIVLHGDTRIDNYSWMRNKKSVEMMSYLKAENNYAEKMMKPTKKLQDSLYIEIVSRIKETDMSVPYKYKDYWYYSRTEKGKDHPVHFRKRSSMEAGTEELLLDANEMVKTKKCYGVYFWEVSPDNTIMAYAIDWEGSFEADIYFKDLATGKTFDEVIHHVTTLAYASDNKTVFYTAEDSISNRSYRLYKHVLGTSPAKDAMIYEERDKKFELHVSLSKSEEYIFMRSESSDESEVYFLPSSDPGGGFILIHPKEKMHDYSVEHYKGKFYIASNKNAVNYRLMEVSANAPYYQFWKEVIPHREDVMIKSFEPFDGCIAVEEKQNGNDKIAIYSFKLGEKYHVPVSDSDAAYVMNISHNPDFNTEWMQYSFSSLKTPNSIYEINLKTKETRLIKRKEIPGGFDPANYNTEKIWADAPDGKKVPLSLLYKKGLVKNGNNPVYITGYGAYGYSSAPYFNNSIFSLVDRGFVFAIAHVRGGDDLGKQWYYDGKMLKKKNSFTDFIACTEQLIKNGFTSSGNIAAQGGSAGGLLMGAIITMRPELFKTVVLDVPFVDVITTMMDTTLPLTTQEFLEWGNPYEKKYYDYMKSYSSYDNILKKDYPNLLFTSGVSDKQVGIWEPAKMVAKLRSMKTNNNLLLFKVTFKGGHAGASGRYGKYRETAFEYAFILKSFGW